MKRLALIVGFLAFLWVAVTPAQAFTIQGGDAAHRGAVASVLQSQPKLLAYVESVFPNFYVRINYGGRAFPEGYMDVSKALMGKPFTDLVAHEFSHMVQLAGDAPGGPASIGDKWLTLLTEHGYGPSTWRWTYRAPWYSYSHPWENFAENAKRAFWSPYYTVRTTPTTYLDWFSRVEMRAFLNSAGVTW